MPHFFAEYPEIGHNWLTAGNDDFYIQLFELHERLAEGFGLEPGNLGETFVPGFFCAGEVIVTGQTGQPVIFKSPDHAWGMAICADEETGEPYTRFVEVWRLPDGTCLYLNVIGPGPDRFPRHIETFTFIREAVIIAHHDYSDDPDPMPAFDPAG